MHGPSHSSAPLFSDVVFPPTCLLQSPLTNVYLSRYAIGIHEIARLPALPPAAGRRAVVRRSFLSAPRIMNPGDECNGLRSLAPPNLRDGSFKIFQMMASAYYRRLCGDFPFFEHRIRHCLR